MERALVAVAAVALALHAGGAWGCSAEPAERDAPVGVVFGHVRLESHALVPMYPAPMLAHDPLRPRTAPEPLPAECARAQLESRMPVTMDAERALAGMVVTASDFRRYRPRQPSAQHVWIERCALRPRTIAITEGDRLVLENRDAFPFAPLHGPAYEAMALPRGQRLFLPTFPGTIEPITCSADAPCGRSDVFVLHHPVHTVTDARGAFRLEVPAGEQVRLTALHPLFEEAETSVWLEPGQELPIELVVRPRPGFAPPP